MKIIFSIILLCLSFTPPKYDRTFTYGKKCPDYYQRCVDVIKHYEKFRAGPYRLFGDRYVGYGHLIKNGETFEVLTENQADSLLRKDFDAGLKYVPDSLQGNKRLLAGMYAYNCGAGKMLKLFKKPVTEQRYLRACHIKGRPHKGLKLRRETEWKMMFAI